MKRKVIRLMLAVLVTVGLVLVGCAPETAPVPEEEEEAPPAALEQEVIKWIGSCGNPSGTPAYELTIKSVSERIAKASNGRLLLTAHPAGAVVPALECFDGVNDGAIDFSDDPAVYWMNRWPAAGLFTFQIGGLSPWEMFHWWVEGGGKDLCRRMVEDTNVHIIDPPGHIAPGETFLWSNEHITGPEDFKGLKIRSAGDDGECFTRMGSSVTLLSPQEVYEGMQRGVLDAFQLSSPGADKAYGTHEVAKYMYLSPVRQPAEYDLFLVNRDKWEALPDDLKELVQAEVYANGANYYTTLCARDILAIEFYKDYGTIVEPVSKEIEEELSRQAQLLYDEKAAKDPFYREVLESLREFQELYREAFPRL